MVPETVNQKTRNEESELADAVVATDRWWRLRCQRTTIRNSAASTPITLLIRRAVLLTRSLRSFSASVASP